jgi:signal transduction histidine kinase
MERKYGLTVALDLDSSPHAFPETLAGVLLRAIRELLFNVVKHAGVSEATVIIRREDGYVCVTVRDHGKGFDPSALEDAVSDTGVGLLGVRQRIEMLDGEVSIDSAPGKGCIVNIRVPCEL